MRHPATRSVSRSPASTTTPWRRCSPSAATCRAGSVVRESAGRPQAIELRGLSIGAMHELLRARLGTRVARPTLVRLWETSAGNPFFALELALALERRGFAFAPGDALPIPSSLDELLRERLDTLERRGRSRSQTWQRLFPSRPSALVGAALGDGADTGLLDAVDAQILELEGNRIRFTHPLLGSAVVRAPDAAARRALHARLAEVVPTEEERARHLALATVRPDREVAAFVEDAARAANARGAPLSAAELADHAVRLTPREAADGQAAAALVRCRPLLRRSERRPGNCPPGAGSKGRGAGPRNAPSSSSNSHGWPQPRGRRLRSPPGRPRRVGRRRRSSPRHPPGSCRADALRGGRRAGAGARGARRRRRHARPATRRSAAARSPPTVSSASTPARASRRRRWRRRWRSSARSPTGPSRMAARSSRAINSGGREPSSRRASCFTSSSARSAPEGDVPGQAIALCGTSRSPSGGPETGRRPTAARPAPSS